MMFKSNNVWIFWLWEQLNGLVQEGRKWLFQVKFFSFKSAWIFACAFQLSSTTIPCIFFLWFALCFWEKQRQNIQACTMTTKKQNKSISARKMMQENVFLLNSKAHAKVQAHANFTWKSHLRPSCTKPFNKPSKPLRPSLKALWGLASKALRSWYERPRARTSPRFFAKIEHGQSSSKLRMPICLYV